MAVFVCFFFCCVCTIIYCICLSLCLHSCLCLDVRLHVFVYVFMHVHECVLFISIYKPVRFLMLFPSVGRALPSHYAGSRTNHRLCVSVSPNLSLFFLLSLVIFLFHSLRQLPSPSGPQSTLITFSSHMYSISLALLSISFLFFLSFLSVILL